MYETSIETLTANGYEHYEVSNFAKPGRRCRHNEHYWANDSYYGFGVGAARYLNGERAHNIRDTQSYIRKVLAGEDASQQRETLPPRERAVETLAVQLRRRDGIERSTFEAKTGYALNEIAGVGIEELVESQLLTDDGKRVSLTHRGLCLADAVIERILRLTHAASDARHEPRR
jgi:oxygen-independent coproporphyrinogen-3 oxidase